MIDYENLASGRPTINYDTTIFTNKGYELKFVLDFENPNLKEVIERCEKNNLPYKVVHGDGRQKHVWIKGWEQE